MAARVQTAIAIWTTSPTTALLSSLSTRVEALRRSLVIALRAVLSASTIRIRGIKASCATPSIASAASPTTRCRHGRDRVTKYIGSARSGSNVTVTVRSWRWPDSENRRAIDLRFGSCVAGRVELRTTGVGCENATKTHSSREHGASVGSEARTCDAVLAPWHTCGWAAPNPQANYHHDTTSCSHGLPVPRSASLEHITCLDPWNSVFQCNVPEIFSANNT